MKEKKDNQNLPLLKIGKTEVKIPIIQGGMGIGISLDHLSKATATAGGIGVIAAVLCGLNKKGFSKYPLEISLEALKEYIQIAKKNSNGAIGVNVMMALTDNKKYINASIQAGADLLFAGAGLLLNPPEGIGLVPIISSGRAAKIILERWENKFFNKYPDAIVVEGFKAGGHLGFKRNQIDNPKFSLEILLADVLSQIKPFEQRAGRKIPVIVAGGIYTGADIYHFIKRGASGVQMGTRFVATHECDAAQSFKDAYIKAKSSIIIESPVGLPGRALKNSFLNNVFLKKCKPKKCITKCLKTCKYPKTPYCISMALINAQKGKLKHGLILCGYNVNKINKIIYVKELIDELVKDFTKTAKKITK